MSESTNDILISQQISTQAAVEWLNRYDLTSKGLLYSSACGPFVAYSDAAHLIAELDERIKELEFSFAGCSQQLKDACADLDASEARPASPRWRRRNLFPTSNKTVKGTGSLPRHRRSPALETDRAPSAKAPR